MAAFMDELVIDPISGEQLTPNHAICIPLEEEECNVLEYLKSVAALVGSKNIRSAYEENGCVKIYLRYVKHVEAVLSDGLVFQGRRVNVKYGIPPATEVTLENVATEIPNNALSKNLSKYGTLVTKITTDKINLADPEYSHIESSTRRTFMHIMPQVTLPPTLFIRHCNYEYCIKVCVGEQTPVDRYRSSLPALPSAGGDTPELKRARTSDGNFKSPSEGALSIGRRGRLRGRRFLRSSSNDVSSGTESVKKGKLQTKVCHLALMGKPNVTSSDKSNPAKATAAAAAPSNADNNAVKESDTELIDSSSVKLNHTEREKFISISKHPGSLSVIETFLHEVKNNRNPRDFAEKMLKRINSPMAIDELYNELLVYVTCCSDVALKNRITRYLPQLKAESNIST